MALLRRLAKLAGSRLLLIVPLLLMATLGVAQDKPLPKELVEVARWKTKLTMFNDLQLTDDGETLLIQDVLGKTEAWDVATKKRLWNLETDSYAHQLNDEDDEEFLWVDQTKSPRAIVHTGLRDGKERKRTPLKEANAKLWNVEFGLGPAPEVGAQAQYTTGPHIVSFSLETGELETVFKLPKQNGQEVEIDGLGVASNCQRFLITARGGVIYCNDDGKVLQSFKTANHVARTRFLPGGKFAMAAGITFGTPVYFLDLETGKTTERKEHRYGTTSLEISTYGKLAVTGGQCRMAAERNYYFRTKQSEGGEVIVWDLEAQQPVAKLNPFVDSVKGVDITHDGQYVAAAETGDTEGQIVIFEVKEKK